MSPVPVMCTTTALPPDRSCSRCPWRSGDARRAQVYFTVEPLGNGPNVVPLPRSTTNTSAPVLGRSRKSRHCSRRCSGWCPALSSIPLEESSDRGDSRSRRTRERRDRRPASPQHRESAKTGRNIHRPFRIRMTQPPQLGIAIRVRGGPRPTASPPTAGRVRVAAVHLRQGRRFRRSLGVSRATSSAHAISAPAPPLVTTVGTREEPCQPRPAARTVRRFRAAPLSASAHPRAMVRPATEVGLGALPRSASFKDYGRPNGVAPPETHARGRSDVRP